MKVTFLWVGLQFYSLSLCKDKSLGKDTVALSNSKSLVQQISPKLPVKHSLEQCNSEHRCKKKTGNKTKRVQCRLLISMTDMAR